MIFKNGFLSYKENHFSAKMNTFTVVLNLWFSQTDGFETISKDEYKSLVERAKKCTSPKDMIDIFTMIDDDDFKIDMDSVRFRKGNDLSLAFDVQTTKSSEDLKKWLLDMPLEDTVYESFSDNGWVLMDPDEGEIGCFDYRYGKSDSIQII